MRDQRTFKDLSELSNLLSPDSKQPVKTGSHDGKGKSVRVYLDTKGRKGKSVTIVGGLQHNPKTMEDIARILKQFCGSGGTVKDGNIEIQGDQRVNVTKKLKEMNYSVQ